MHREYHKWFSPHLQKDMELLVFGHSGSRIIFFPTRTARFYDYENWKVIEALRGKINNGLFQIYCVDSVDSESFYNKDIHPADRIKRHMSYEQYILNEVLPLSQALNPNSFLISAGCSLGAYHAMNIAIKHPELFGKVLAMSGRFDLTMQMSFFDDLFDGYRDENIYFNTPNQFLTNLHDPEIINQLKRMEIIMVIGEDDVFLENNRNFSSMLWDEGIWNALHIWHEEAHKPRYWREMLNQYL
jgi:esterase/lipase superfamily enzyme